MPYNPISMALRYVRKLAEGGRINLTEEDQRHFRALSRVAPRGIPWERMRRSEEIEDRRNDPPSNAQPASPGEYTWRGPVSRLGEDAGFYDTERRNSLYDPNRIRKGDFHRAAGGQVPVQPYMRRPRGSIGPGLVKSAVPGRTDKISGKLPGGSYVLPADVVSGSGENNTLAGGQKISKIFGQSDSFKASSLTRNLKPSQSAKSVRQRFAYGGENEEADVIIAGGEHILYPEDVARVGGGDPEQGYKVLDAFVRKVRAKNIKTLKSLPPPVK